MNGNLKPGNYTHPWLSIQLWGWIYNVKLKQFTCLNAYKFKVLSSRKVHHWPLVLSSRSETYPKTSHLLSSFSASWSWSAETCGVIAGSLHPQTGEHRSHDQDQWAFFILTFESYWFLVFVSIWLREALGKEVACALMRLCWKGEKELNKLSCICLLYMKVPYKQQSPRLINIQSCRNETINVCTKLLTTMCSIYKCSYMLRGVVVDRPRNQET